jgi:hypothetical protein
MLALIGAPTLLVGHDLAGRSVSLVDQLKALMMREVATLQAIGGLAILVGAYATWRRLRIAEYELQATRDARRRAQVAAGV